MICSIGDVFGGCTRFCVFSRVFIFLRIFAEFSRKFARKVHEEPHGVGLRFFFYTIAKVFRRFQVARDSFSLLKPRKLRSRFSKFRIFALIVLLRLEANLSGSTLTCRFTFICRFWVLLKVCRLIPSRTTGWRHDDRSIRARTLFFKVVFCAFFV